MTNHTFSIVLAVCQLLTGIVLTLIMQRFGRLESRVDKVDTLLYERSRELSVLSEGQRLSNILVTEIKYGQGELRKELKEDLDNLSRDIKEATRTAMNLVRYGIPGKEKE